VSTLWGEPVAVVVYAVMLVLLALMVASGLRRLAQAKPEHTNEKELVER